MPIRQIKAKNQRSKRILKKREPKLVENTKQLLLLKSKKTKKNVIDFLTDLNILKKPFTKFLHKPKNIFPFEDITPIEFLCKKNDCSLFVFGSDSKKRPSNLVLGRLYDFSILQMFEFELTSYQKLKDFKNKGMVIDSNTRPIFCFQGDLFNKDENLIKIKNFLLDIYRRENIDNVSLSSLTRVLVFNSITKDQIIVKQFALSTSLIDFKPKIKLEEMGHSFRLKLRRNFQVSDSVFNESLKKVKLKKKVVKNTKTDKMGHKVGKIYINRPDFSQIAQKKFKGYKKLNKTKDIEKENN